jgi:hypothetical protein
VYHQNKHIIAYNLVNFGQYARNKGRTLVTEEIFGIMLRIRISW